MEAKEISVFAADIGSVQKDAFAWASSCQPGGRSLEGLVDAIVRDLAIGQAVALGFEAPMWVPLAEQPSMLTRARHGENNRPWSAGAGCGALATGLVQSIWILRQLRKHVPSASIHLDWSGFRAARGARLFLWEALVSSASKGADHAADAAIAVNAFMDSLPEPPTHALVRPGDAVFSLLGAAIIRAGWSIDASLLGAPCLVLGPHQSTRTRKVKKSAR